MSRHVTIITPSGPVDISDRLTGVPRVQRGQGLGATTDDPTRVDMTLLDSDGLLDPARSPIGVGRSTLVAVTAQPPGSSTHRSEFSGSLSSTAAGWGSEVDEGLDWSTPAGQTTTWSVSSGFGRALIGVGETAETRLWDTTRDTAETGEHLDLTMTVDAVSGSGNTTTVDVSLGRDGRTGRGEGAWVSARVSLAAGGLTTVDVRYLDENDSDTFVNQTIIGGIISATPELVAIRVLVVAGYVGAKVWLTADPEPDEWDIWQQVPAIRQVSGSTTLRMSHSVGTGPRTVSVGRVEATRCIARAVGEAQSWDVQRYGREQDNRVLLSVTSSWRRLGLSRLGLSPLSRSLPQVSGALGHWSMEDGPDELGPGDSFASSPGLATTDPLTLVSRAGVGEAGVTSGRVDGIAGSAPVPVMVTARARVRVVPPPSPNPDLCAVWAHIDLGGSSRTNETLVFADIRIGDGRRWIGAILPNGGGRIEAQDLETGVQDVNASFGPLLSVNRGPALVALEWEMTGASTAEVRLVALALDGLGATFGLLSPVTMPTNVNLRLSQIEVAAAGGEFVGLGHIVPIQPSGSDPLPSVFTAANQARAYRRELSSDRVERILTEIGETPTVAAERALDRCGEQPLSDPIGVLADAASPAGSIYDDRGTGRLGLRLRTDGRPDGVDDDHRGELTIAATIPWSEIRRDRTSRLDVRRTASSVLARRPDGSTSTETTDKRSGRDPDSAQLTSSPPPAGIGELQRSIDVNPAARKHLSHHAAWNLTQQSSASPRLGDVVIETFSSGVSTATAAAIAAVTVGDIVDITGEPGALAEGQDRARLRITRQQEDLLGGDPRNVRYTWTAEPARRSIVGVWGDPATSSGPTRWSPPPSPVTADVGQLDTTVTLINQAPEWTTDVSAYPVRVVIFDPPTMTREIATVTSVSGRTLTLSRSNPVEHPAGALVVVDDDAWTGRYGIS